LRAELYEEKVAQAYFADKDARKVGKCVIWFNACLLLGQNVLHLGCTPWLAGIGM
jgi:hypothetical protein